MRHNRDTFNIRTIVLVIFMQTWGAGFARSAAFAGIPAPGSGGPVPTIELADTNGYALESIGVSGTGATGYAKVRIVILVDVGTDGLHDRTRLLAIASTGGGDSYATDVVIPDDIAIGSTKICAAGDAETSGFVCEPFEVVAPPSASITGVIGLAATDGDTELLVYDAATGAEAASVSMSTSGGFAIEDLPPGEYELVVVGDVIAPFDIGPVVVSPAEALVIDEPELEPVGLVSGESCGVMAFGVPMAKVARVTSDVHGRSIVGITGIETTNIGRFIAGAGGPPVSPTFTAKVQTGIGFVLDGVPVFPPLVNVDGVRFRIVDSAGEFVWEDIATSGVPFSVTHPDVGSLAPGRYVIGCAIKHEDAALEKLLGPCWGKYAEFEVLANPTDDTLYSSGAVNWLPESSRYAFAGWMPDIAGLLSAEFPAGGLSVPYLGDLTSGFSAGVNVSGFIDLDGHVELTGSRAAAQVLLLGRIVYDETFLSFLNGATVGEAGSVFGGPLGPFGERSDPRAFTLRSAPHYLYDFFRTWPVWSGEVVNLWGIVVVRVSVDLALSAYAYLFTTQQPVEPRLGATLVPEAIPSLNVAVKVKLLLGLAKGRADVRTEAILNWPVQYDSGSVPNIFLDDPCLGLRMILTASAKVLRKKYRLSPQELFCKENGACVGFCEGGGRSLRGAGNEILLPDAYATPALATGTDGRVLATYVEDTNSNGTGMGLGDPDQTVIARFWNPMTSSWNVPLVVSDQQFAALDPAAAFTGTNGDAWVVYAQSTIDEDVDPVPTDLADVLAAQEIVAAYWDESAQSFTHEYLTTDGVPIGDGSAAIDSDTTGVTAAWLRDLDGDVATRNDWTIAVRNWIDGLGWDEMELLDASATLDGLLGGSADALNAEVGVVRDGGNAYLIWTADADGDIDTHDDRRVVLAVGTPVSNPSAATPHYFTWSIEASADLPAGAEQPSADFNPVTGELEIAMTVRGKDADGLTDAGVGTSNLLWHARRNAGGVWGAEQLMDDGDEIRCEAPELRIGPNGRVVVFMRRFEGSTPGRYRGQLAMIVREGGSMVWPDPVWITDDWSQHWDQTTTIDSAGQAFLVDVNRLDAPPEAPVPFLNPCLPESDLNDVDEPVQVRILPPAADPVMDTALAVSRLHAEEDALVTVTATVRNAGLDAATNIRVQFFDGPDALSPLLDEVIIAGPLTFNQSQTAEVLVDRHCGPQPIFARLLVDGPGVDRCSMNNDADVIDIGVLPPPLRTGVTPSSLVANAVEITAVAPDADEIAGYRFLRATASGGPYENVGESVQPVLTDCDVTRGVTYYYVVTAYDDCAVFSSHSEEVSIDLPVITNRQWAAPFPGPWDNPAGWLPGGVPANGDDVIINAPGVYTISLGQDAVAGSLMFGFAPGNQVVDLGNRTLSLLKPSQIGSGGTLRSVGGALQLNLGALTNQGVMESYGPANLITGALMNDAMGQMWVRLNSPAPADITISQALVNNGQILLDAAGFPAPVTLDVQDGVLANKSTGQIVSSGGPGPQNVIRAALRNEGIITVNKDLSLDEPMVTHVNLGTVNVIGGNLTFQLSGSDAAVINAGHIDVLCGRQMIVTGGPLVHGGNLNIAPSALGSFTHEFTQYTGVTTCNGTLTAPQIDLKGGILQGVGQVAGPLLNESGIISPGMSPGSLAATGGLTQGPQGVLHIELGGLTPVSEYDVLNVTGDATLDGILTVELIGMYDPPVGTTFDILVTTAGTVSGQFASIEPLVLATGRAVDATYLPDRVRLTIFCASGDADCDGDVDIDDHAIFVDCVAGPGAAPNPTPPTTAQECLDAFDIDADSDIDLYDYTEFQVTLGGP